MPVALDGNQDGMPDVSSSTSNVMNAFVADVGCGPGQYVVAPVRGGAKIFRFGFDRCEALVSRDRYLYVVVGVYVSFSSFALS